MVPDPLIWGPIWGVGGSFHDDGSELVISASLAQGSRQFLISQSLLCGGMRVSLMASLRSAER